MTRFIRTLALALLALFGSHVAARQITLFDPEGSAIAYIDIEQQLTIYLWDGTPVAYLDKTSIYGFNGKHLGWLNQGIVRDHQGNGVGFVQGAVSKLTKLEPLKALQKLSPLRSIEELGPLEPLPQNKWSGEQLELFLSRGAK